MIWEWVNAHPDAVWWMLAASVLTFVGTLGVVPLLLVRLPKDYFARSDSRNAGDWRKRHPIVRWTLRVLKNAVGAVFVLAGLALLVTPGQGVLTILLGVVLLDLPGKRRLEIALVRRPKVLSAINWLRRRAHQPPLELPDSLAPPT